MAQRPPHTQCRACGGNDLPWVLVAKDTRKHLPTTSASVECSKLEVASQLEY